MDTVFIIVVVLFLSCVIVFLNEKSFAVEGQTGLDTSRDS